MILSFIEPTSSRNMSASSPVRAACKSSRMVDMIRRELSAFDLRVLNTSAAVTDSE